MRYLKTRLRCDDPCNSMNSRPRITMVKYTNSAKTARCRYMPTPSTGTAAAAVVYAVAAMLAGNHSIQFAAMKA